MKMKVFSAKRVRLFAASRGCVILCRADEPTKFEENR